MATLEKTKSVRSMSPVLIPPPPPDPNTPHYALHTSSSFRLTSPSPSFRRQLSRMNSSSRSPSPRSSPLSSPKSERKILPAEPPEPAALRCHIDAQLTINSLILLGFDSDEYIKTYSGIAYDLIPLNRDTFEHSGGDKMLLIVLHYLLCILDPEHFLNDIQSCWPYLDAKERNAYKHAVNASMKRLMDENILPAGIYQSSHLNNHDKNHTWHLLRSMTDVCIDMMLPERPVDDDFTRETDKDILLQMMEAQLDWVTKLIADHHDVTDEYQQYLEELVGRLQAANRTLTKQQHQQQADARNGQSNHANSQANERNKRKILGPNGVKLRREKLGLIRQKKELLQKFIDTELLQQIEKFLEDDAEQIRALKTSAGGKRRTLRRAKSMSPEDLEEYQAQIKGCLDQLIASIDRACEHL